MFTFVWLEPRRPETHAPLVLTLRLTWPMIQCAPNGSWQPTQVLGAMPYVWDFMGVVVWARGAEQFEETMPDWMPGTDHCYTKHCLAKGPAEQCPAAPLHIRACGLLDTVGFPNKWYEPSNKTSRVFLCFPMVLSCNMLWVPVEMTPWAPAAPGPDYVCQRVGDHPLVIWHHWIYHFNDGLQTFAGKGLTSTVDIRVADRIPHGLRISPVSFG